MNALTLGTSAQNCADDTPPAVALATYRIADESHVTTTSLQIAQHFGKAHKSVLRAIKNLECDEEFGRRNFAPSSYLNEQGKEQPSYHITRDGFALLAMGFIGKEAMRWKITYLQTFNRMEKALREHYVEALLDDKHFRQGIPLRLKLTLQDQGRRLMSMLLAEPARSARLNLYWQLFQVNASLGIPTESMAVLVGDALPALALTPTSKPNP